MARLPRLSLAGLPQHVIQRGHNGQSIFLRPADYQFMLDLLLEYARKFEVAVHAYVLLPNHFHLLVTPQTASGLAHMLQALGRRYVRYFNDAQGRTGTLWDGRYRSTVLQAGLYLLPCMAGMDLNPVRAGLSNTAADYAWSSHGHYIGRSTDRLVTPHAQFWGLGNTPFAREAAYAELVAAGVDSTQHQALTDATLKGWVLGDAAFVQELQKATPRRLSKGQAGRPARSAASE
ncbi:MAG: transposase [Rhodoferax sp.]|nr:transposase [Rhodoferax sp.]